MNMLTRNDGSWNGELRNFNSMVDLFMREMGMRPAKWFDEGFDSRLQLKVEDKAVTALLPCAGCKGSDFQVDVVGDMLNVSVKHASCDCENEGKAKKHFVKKERCVREFSESIQLPVPVNGQDATAKYEDGVLTVTIPRVAEETGKLHTVKVN